MSYKASATMFFAVMSFAFDYQTAAIEAVSTWTLIDNPTFSSMNDR